MTKNSVVLMRLLPNKNNNYQVNFSNQRAVDRFLHRSRGYCSEHYRKKSYFLNASGEDGIKEWYAIVKIHGNPIEDIDYYINDFYQRNFTFKHLKKFFQSIKPVETTKEDREKRKATREATKVILIKINHKYRSLIDAANDDDHDFKKLQKILQA